MFFARKQATPKRQLICGGRANEARRYSLLQPSLQCRKKIRKLHTICINHVHFIIHFVFVSVDVGVAPMQAVTQWAQEDESNNIKCHTDTKDRERGAFIMPIIRFVWGSEDIRRHEQQKKKKTVLDYWHSTLKRSISQGMTLFNRLAFTFKTISLYETNDVIFSH